MPLNKKLTLRFRTTDLQFYWMKLGITMPFTREEEKNQVDWNPPYQSQITEFFVLNLVKQFTSLLWYWAHWFWSSSTNVQMSRMNTVIQYTKEFPTKPNPENADWFCFEFVAKSKILKVETDDWFDWVFF